LRLKTAGSTVKSMNISLTTSGSFTTLLKVGYAIVFAAVGVNLLAGIAGQIVPPPPASPPLPVYPTTQEACVEQGGSWVEASPEAGSAFCGGQLRVELEWQEKSDEHTVVLQLVLIIGGAIAAAAGLFVRQYSALAGSLLLTGIFALYNSMRAFPTLVAFEEQSYVILIAAATLGLGYLGWYLWREDT
jgi:hypothetical protein